MERVLLSMQFGFSVFCGQEITTTVEQHKTLLENEECKVVLVLNHLVSQQIDCITSSVKGTGGGGAPHGFFFVADE
jgi:hypothetical protein